jgi:hypothetical protein
MATVPTVKFSDANLSNLLYWRYNKQALVRCGTQMCFLIMPLDNGSISGYHPFGGVKHTEPLKPYSHK